MTPQEHYAEGERLLARADKALDQLGYTADWVIKLATVAHAHFAAATAAATLSSMNASAATEAA